MFMRDRGVAALQEIFQQQTDDGHMRAIISAVQRFTGDKMIHKCIV